jgi:hypothetical protein
MRILALIAALLGPIVATAAPSEAEEVRVVAMVNAHGRCAALAHEMLADKAQDSHLRVGYAAARALVTEMLRDSTFLVWAGKEERAMFAYGMAFGIGKRAHGKRDTRGHQTGRSIL